LLSVNGKTFPELDFFAANLDRDGSKEGVTKIEVRREVEPHKSSRSDRISAILAIQVLSMTTSG
jgi:hypothetical protein